MSKTKRNTKPEDLAISARSPVALAASLRGGAGVHADQRRKADPKVTRRDKSYKNVTAWA